ncbi:Uncharacterised protein [Chryseobacterium indoltheticum]|uniref:Uncharacterized protein n=1 Tax=Chryseobacterium indoltheticum TaxID=254 RepID=A0A381FED7_9FLAO|nr:Uncharacterised protein [Chryseobacterium indoltheticum]
MALFSFFDFAAFNFVFDRIEKSNFCLKNKNLIKQMSHYVNDDL